MSFSFRPAKREDLWWLLGLAGGTGSGKTYTGMRVAKGLAGDRPFAVIDTENDRAKHYADDFRFDHCGLSAPFRSDRYGEAILAAANAGYSVILVDSMSHEYAGDGGTLDWQEEELQRLTKGDMSKADSYKMLAWQPPKRAHKKFVNEVLLQVKAHIICCFRAEPKTEMAKENGRTVVREKSGLMAYNGWCPITDKQLPFEMTAYFMFMAEKPGVPIPIKLQEQHKRIFATDRTITEGAGVAMGEWARGSASTSWPATPESWIDRIKAAATGRELEAISEQLKLAQASLPESAVAIIRGEYTDRWNALASKSRSGAA